MKALPSSLRLNPKLLKDAEKESEVSFRTIPKQIEYWAHIGQEVAPLLKASDLIALLNGEAEIQVIQKKSQPVDMDFIFSELESDRVNKKLKAKVLTSKVWYGINPAYPDYLEQTTHDGEKTIGKFVDGEFKPLEARKQKAK